MLYKLSFIFDLNLPLLYLVSLSLNFFMDNIQVLEDFKNKINNHIKKLRLSHHGLGAVTGHFDDLLVLLEIYQFDQDRFPGLLVWGLRDLVFSISDRVSMDLFFSLFFFFFLFIHDKWINL